MLFTWASQCCLIAAPERQNRRGNLLSAQPPHRHRSGTPYTYAYNARNCLATVTSGALIWGYAYNGLEQLVVRELTNAGPDLTHFVHDRFGNVIAPTFGAIRFG